VIELIQSKVTTKKKHFSDHPLWSLKGIKSVAKPLATEIVTENM